MTQELTITYKLANPDNFLEIEKITELFHEVHKEKFPRTGVYNDKFWNRHLNRDLKSILIFGNDKLLGHIALKADTTNKKHLELTLPAFSSKLMPYKEKVAEIIKGLISKNAKTQSWELVYCFLFNECKNWHEISENALGMHEVALCPDYIDAKEKEGEQNQDVVISVKCFSKNEISGTMPINVHIPKKHLEISKALYEPLNLNRKFKSNSTSKIGAALHAEGRAIESNYFSKASVSHTFINPSMLNDDTNTLSKLNQHPANSNYIFVNLFDSKAPSFCDRLEEYDFKFCGVLPLFKGRDSIVYFRSKGNKNIPNTKKMPTERTKNIANYINTYIFSGIL